MIENAVGMVRIREIAEAGKGHLDGLLVGENSLQPDACRPGRLLRIHRDLICLRTVCGRRLLV